MILRFYKTLQHLSIDIVIGAVILLHFFSSPFDIEVEWQVYVLLASSVWVIYTLDHLRDASAAKDSTRDRYLFHRKNSRLLKIVIGIVIILSITCLFYLPETILIFGGILSLLCLIYIFFQARLAAIGLKELYVAAMYSLGILLTPFSLTESFNVHLFLMLLIMAFLNLIIFSWFEEKEDCQDFFSSIATILGKRNTQKLIVSVCALGLAIGISGIGSLPEHSIYFFLVTMLYLFIIINPEWSGQKHRYRSLGDAAFIVPVIFEFV